MEEELYLQGILNEINEIKARGGKGLFRINAKIKDNVAKYVQRHFNGNIDYDVDIKKCMTCTGTWDILIYFRKL